MLHSVPRFPASPVFSRFGTRQSWNSVLRPLLPSFVADYLFPDHRPTWRLHSTSYLDGLRGIASVIVFICHYTEENFGALTASYGIHEDEPSGLLQLPYLRIIFSGRPMVHIFFVISGFVLSYKPIKAIHARDLDQCYNALASSTFRRAFRLFGPCIVSTLIVLYLFQTGYLVDPAPLDTWTGQFWRWKGAVFHQISWPWAWDRDLRPAYDIHLWTIPIEFVHSMLLFMVILMLSRIRLRIRQAAVFGLMAYCLACGKWAGFEFLAGMFLAEVHLLQHAQPKAWESSDIGDEADKDVLASIMKVLHLSLIFVGLFIGGWPNFDADKTPGIRYFLAQTPFPFAAMDPLAPQKFWFGLSAVFIVWSVGELAFLRNFFEGPVAQYCGRISYAVYICHGPVLGLFQEPVLGFPYSPPTGSPGVPGFKKPIMGWGVKGHLGVANSTQTTVSWFFGLCIIGPMVIWAADVFWRAVDTPVVNLGKKLENACLDDAEPSPRSQGYSAAA
ncbi:acyltransferase 3 [Lasiosphaeria ovina]|uniref:Acyltransferase 3 n=1 Tax=Lasiosphaeria ovina TaxID=92902 RepID=A0AAE0NK15_9PEZI|nr:acyltransferase 3 [Lasiosphaeria ovina]